MATQSTKAEVTGELLIAWQKYIATSADELSLKEGDVVELLDTDDPTTSKKLLKLDPSLETTSTQLLDSSAAKHKLSVKPRRTYTSSRHSPTRLNLHARWLVREVSGARKQGWVPCKLLQTLDDPVPGQPGLPGDATFRRQAVVKELVETEQEFVRDLDYVVQNYLTLAESSKKVPKVIRDNFEMIFGNLREIAEFHRTVLMEGVRYYANEPHLLGKAFLRLERDFDKHVNYYMDEPQAQLFLDTCDEAREYFDELSQKLDDDKTIIEHLKLPIQRINDYQLLLKELVRYSACLNEDNSNLQKALELMLSVPHRAQDDKFINSIEGYRGSIHKLGRLLAHDWWSVTFGTITKERYLFLFKGRILICKVRRISEDRSVFQLKDIIKLNQIFVKDHAEDRIFELVDKIGGQSLVLTAHRDHIKDYWLKEIAEFAGTEEVDQETDDFQIASPPTENKEQNPHKPEIKVTEFSQEEKAQKTEVTPPKEVKAAVVPQQQEKKTQETEAKPPKEEVKTSTALEQANKVEEAAPVKSEVKDLRQKKSPLEKKQSAVSVPKKSVENVEGAERNTRKPSEPLQSTTNPTNQPLKPDDSSAHLPQINAVEPLVQINKKRQLEEVVPYVPKQVPEIHGSALQKVYGVESIGLSDTILTDFRVGVEVTVESGDDMSRKYTSSSAKAEGYSDSAYNRRSTQSAYSTDGLSSSKYSTDTGSKYESLASKYGKSGDSSYLTSSYTSRRGDNDGDYSSYKSIRSSTGDSEGGYSSSYSRKSLKSSLEGNGDYSSTRRSIRSSLEGDGDYSSIRRSIRSSLEGDGDYSSTRRSIKSSLEGEGDYSSTRRSIKSSLEGDGDSYSKRYRLGDNDYSRKSISDLKSGDDSYSTYTRRSIRNASSEIGDGSNYAKRTIRAEAEALDDGNSYTVRKSFKSSADGDLGKRGLTNDGDEDLVAKYSRKYSIDKKKGGEAEEDVYAKFTRKYSRGSSSDKKTEESKHLKTGEEDIYTKYSRKYSREESSDTKSRTGDDDSYGKYSKKYSKEETKTKDEDDDPYTRYKKKYSMDESFTKKTKVDDEHIRKSSERKSYTHDSDKDESISIKSETTIISGTEVKRETKESSIETSKTTEVQKTATDKVEELDEGRPRFIKTIRGTNIEPGEAAHFEVALNEKPASFSWLKDNQTINGNSNLSGRIQMQINEKTHEYKLVIRQANIEDSGTYTAIATSETRFKTSCSAQLIVHELTTAERMDRSETDRPEFLVQMKDTELLEDTYLRFMVKICGEPNPEIAFFKDGVKIQEDDDHHQIIREHSDKGFYELLIPEVKKTDAGIYKCVATNKFGESSSEAVVTVTDNKQVFEEMPEGEILPKGEKPVFHWKKDGVPFEPEERFKVLMGDDEDSLALIFQHVKPDDVGLYTCVAQTSRGHISCSAELTVHGTVNQLFREPEKPSLVIEKKEPIVVAGGSAMLELQVKGYPKPNVKFSHEGKEIEASSKYKFLYEDEETMSLVIKDVESSDAGKYKITAENELGSDSAEMTLTVKKPPKVKVKTESVDVHADLLLQIPVEIEGFPKPQVSFYKDGKEVKQTERIKIVEKGEKHILVIEKTSLKDTGSYSVVATNELAQVSDFWKIDIHSKPKIIEKLGKDRVVSQSEKFELKVKMEAEPAPEVKWYKDDTELSTNDHYLIKNDGDTYILRITGAVTTDSASYKVKGLNIHGTVEDEVRVDVKKAPKITKPLHDMTVTEHDTNVIFDVKLESFPKPTVKWFLDEMEITETRNEFTRLESDDGVKLVIKEVTSELSGKYTCKLSNECGTAETSAKLTVNCAPRIVKHLQDATVEEGANLHLEVEVEACPSPTFKWLRNGREVTSDARIKISRNVERHETYNLAVNLIKYEEQGEYEVIVTNTLGTVNSKSYVTVHKVTHTDAEEVAEPPKKVKFEIKEDEDEKYFKLPQKRQTEEPDKIKDVKGSFYEKTVQIEEKILGNDSSEPIIEEPNSPQILMKTTIIEETQIIEEDEDEEFPRTSNRNKSYHIEEITENDSKSSDYEVETPTKSMKVVWECEEIQEVNKKPTSVTESGLETDKKIKRSITTTKEEAKYIEKNEEIDKPEIPEESDFQANKKLKRGISAQKEDIVIIEEKLDEKPKIPQEKDLETNKKLKRGISAQKEEAQEVEGEIDTKSKKPEEKDLETIKKLKRGISAQKEDVNVIEEKIEEKPKKPEENNLETNKKLKRGISAQKEEIEEIEEEIGVKPKKPEEADLKTTKKLKRGISAQKEDVTLIEEKIEETPKKLEEKDLQINKKLKRGISAQKEEIDEIEEKLEAKPKKPEEKDLETNKKLKRGISAQKEDLELVEEKIEVKPKQLEEIDLETNKKLKRGISAQKEETNKNEINLEEPKDIKIQEYKEKDQKGKMDVQKEDAELENLLERAKRQRSLIEDISKKSTEAVPTILDTNMKDGSRPESLDITYIVRGTANPPPTAKWSLNGKEIKPDSHLRMTASQDGEEFKLEIKHLEMKDAGTYQCVLSNPLGDIKQQAVLEVTPEKELRRPKLKEGLQDQRIVKKNSVTFKAVVVGDPIPDAVWYKDGIEITNDEFEKFKMILETEDHEIEDGLKECTYSLTIPRCERCNAGIYKFVAKNKWDECESSALLTVILRPEIQGPDSVSVVPGEPALFTAIIQSNPVPDVTWSKDDKIVKPTEDIEILADVENETYKLKFNKTLLADEGYYKVTAKNELGETSSEARLKAIKETEPTSEKPHFITGLNDDQVEHTGEITVMVRADGLPKPEIRWFINSKPIVNDNKHKIETHAETQVTSTLTVMDFNDVDIGIYKALAVNVVGEAETSCRISMQQTPPTFGKRLERSQEIAEGEPLELRAKINGSPKPTVAWFKDGEPLKDDRVKTTLLPDGTVKLNIDKCTPEDSGAYKLVVKNVNGETACLCAVAVAQNSQRPKFLKCFKDVLVPTNESLRLEAKIQAYPPPEIKWLKDGLPVRPTSNIHMEKHPDGTVALVVDCTRPENAGKYELIATNKLGESSAEGAVQIEKRPTKPEFITKLQPQTVVEGFPVRFEVKVDGFPAPKITWMRNGTEVISDKKHIIIKDLPDGGSVLLLDAADQARDALNYRAVATNEAGEAETSAVLTVTSANKDDQPEEKPLFLHALKDVITDEGQTLVLQAPFTGNPIPSVEWTKDGVPLQPSERLLMTCDGKRVGLTIDSAVLADAGQYGVTITNPSGKDTSQAKATVHKVFMTPSFTQKFTDLQQLPDRDAKFPCRVTGVPQPEVVWSKDGVPIRESDKYHIRRDGDACCLTVVNCGPKDAGVYRATATNKEGQDVCTATLEVVKEIKTPQKIEPPVFLKRIGDTELFKSMTAKFTACASGIPEPTVEWYHNDQKLFPSNRIKMETDRAGLLRLTIAGVDVDDLGKYSCKITNEHGSDICHANLNLDSGIEPKPKRPITEQYTDFDKYKRSGAPVPISDAPIISQMTDRHCTLSWKPSIPSASRFPVTYQLEMCELPNGDWFTVRSGIRSCTCGVRNLEPFRDYKFRVRVENKYGISEPSPFAITHREKLEPDLPKFRPYLPPEIDFRPETSPYFPKDFDIERPPHDNMAQAPRFLRQEHDTQYGVKDQNTNLFWFVYGYPKPKMYYYFNDELIDDGGGRFDTSYTRNGQATLFINKMLDRDVGWYEAVARNEHGEARQRVRLDIAEPPFFVQRPDIDYVMLRGRARFEARISGVPYPEIKWYRDWLPLAQSSRTRIQFVEPDTHILIINDVISKDEGLYSVSARNVGGSASASAMLHIEESDLEYNYHTYSGSFSPIKLRKKLYEDYYDIGDELGRGTQGITYHAVERINGRNWAAKIMYGRDDLRPFMYNEYDMLNQLRHRKLIGLHDAYETDDSLALILDLGSGGELVNDYLLRQDYYTERDIAGFIRQTLQGLEYMHGRGYGHMGLTLGDLLISHPGGDDLRICDFGLTRRITMGHLAPLNYGMPEYVSPEAVNGEGTGLAHDMWSIGIITYILLSGRSPFRGADDVDTMLRIRENRWAFDDDWWVNISGEARDFITRLLVYQSEDRMDVHAALRHPWLERADKIYTDEYRISSRYLSDYWRSYREWYDNASCQKWLRRRTLESAFSHPSRMVYPPGEYYSPRPTPAPLPRKIPTWEDQLPARSPLNYEIGQFKSESHYQNGPDTYLLQLRDVDFPVRLREYFKVAGSRGPGSGFIVSDENGYDWTTPTIRERRRFTDVMDEEIDDERKARINRYGSSENSYSIRRLKHELGSRLDTYVEAEAFLESKQDGRLPFFREKPQITAMVEGKDLEMACLAVGEPEPIVQWFKNDSIVAESHRIKITTDDEGRSHYTLSPALAFDQGMYKVVARNKIGQTIARARIVLGMVPDEPDSPEAAQISDTEILLTWKQPKFDGNSPVLCYSLEYKLADDMEWTKKAENIDHEFYLIGDLQPNSSYIFRLAAKNAIGWSEAGVPSGVVKTKSEDCPKIQLSQAMLHLQQLTDGGQEVEAEAKIKLNYEIEANPVEWQNANVQEDYNFISEIAKGQFSTVLKAIDKRNDQVLVAKVLELNGHNDDVEGEFAALRSLRHERIAGLIAAYKSNDLAIFIMEKLQGADVLTYLASKHEYTEQTVTTIVSQVLDGLQYLHWRGLCHLDLQPDNVVMCGVRSVQVKLIDFGAAHRVTKLGTKVPVLGLLDYTSPEVLSEEPAYPQTDIWSVGVLTYVMLSGIVPFRGEDDNETRQNILFVRYRFEHLYKEISQESTRFLMLLFKRQPNKRPTAEECHENRWLLPTDYMIKKRERAVFLGNRLKEYCDEYHNRKAEVAQDLTSKLGGNFNRSHSIQEELLTAP